MMKGVEYERFLKERNAKEDEQFRVYDTYTPNYKRQIVTNKFYSKYEVIDLTKADPIILSNVIRAKESEPKDRKPYPETVNQRVIVPVPADINSYFSYGWFSEPLFSVDRKDCRFYFPRRQASFITQEMKIKNDICSKRVLGSTAFKR